MARVQRQRELSSSLFPFLSVLACVIGMLTLLIAALAIGQVAEDLLVAETDPAHAEEIDAERARVRALEARLRDAVDVGLEREAVAAELRALGIPPEADEKERSREVRARLASAQLARRLQQLEREERELELAIHGVRTALLSEDEKDDSPPIRILPRGTARPLRPFFVECRAEGLRVYHENLEGSLYLSRRDPANINDFRVFLQRVRAIRGATVIFLIRPNGVASYEWARDNANRLYVRHAKLPLPGDGELRFAL